MKKWHHTAGGVLETCLQQRSVSGNDWTWGWKAQLTSGSRQTGAPANGKQDWL